jgi:hypothetical protein
MKRLKFGILAVTAALATLAADASADGWAGTPFCSARDRDFPDTFSNGSAASSDSHAQMSVTVDSRGGTDISVQLGDPPQQHGSSHFWHRGSDNTCLPQRTRRLGPN